MATCYCKDSGDVLSQENDSCGGATPCKPPAHGEFVQCCGGGSTCGSNGFCFSNDQTSGNGVTGYYMGGCTDPSFQDPSCPQQCTDRPKQDVVWLMSKQQWACCATGDSYTCDSPTNETFNAPAPDRLTFAAASSSSSSSAAAATTKPTTSTTGGPVAAQADATGAPATASSNGPSAATIALATVLAVLALAILGFLLFLWRRRVKRQHSQYTYRNEEQPGTEVSTVVKPNIASPNEVGTGAPREKRWASELGT